MRKKPTRKRPYFTMESAMTAILRDTSGKMHHGILSDRRRTRPKVAPEQLQHNRNFTEVTAPEINHNLVGMFIEVSVVYRFCYKPKLTLKQFSI